MPIEGPLREFGLHDVFQLVDMSRKTGRLRVTSDVRNDEGQVYFDGGKVVHAGLRSRPASLEDVLVEAGRITTDELAHARQLVADHAEGVSLTDMFIHAGVVSAHDLEQLLRQRLEAIVFDLMTWREGFFLFEEGPLVDVPAGARLAVATESLLMESARRIDEWSRIADKVPNMAVVPVLAPAPERETQLDLLPHEWEVLSLIDGARDLRAIASALGRTEFDVAKVAYGLATTGIIEIRKRRLSSAIALDEPALHAAVTRARALLSSGESAAAVAELRQATARESGNTDLHIELAFMLVRTGDLEGARASLERALQLDPDHGEARRVRFAAEAIDALQRAIAEHHGG